MIIISKNIGVHGELSVSLGGFLERLRRLVAFSGFLSNKTQKQKMGLQAVIPFSCGWQFELSTSLNGCRILHNYDEHYINNN